MEKKKKREVIGILVSIEFPEKIKTTTKWRGGHSSFIPERGSR